MNMKIAFLFPPWSIGQRPLNFFSNNFTISKRGATGSEIGIVEIASWFAKFGHDVSLFTVHTPGTKPDTYENVKLYHWEETSQIDNSYDAVISWSEFDPLRGFNGNYIKTVCMMLNDWTYCQPNAWEVPDLITVPSNSLKEHLFEQMPATIDKSKWHIVPLGADPNWYKNKERKPGSVVSISSADRGSHLLLQQWPQIKKAVPEANLKVYYHLDEGYLDTLQPNDTTRHPNVLRLAMRSRWIKNALQKLKPLDVEHIGSASRVDIAEALSTSLVGVGPLSLVCWSEGWSVASTELCCAGVLPIIGNIDALGEIYGSVAAMVDAPVENHLEQFTNLVIRGLTDEKWRNEITERCQKWAQDYTWEQSSKKLEQLILNHPKYKKEKMIPEITMKQDNSVWLNIAAGPNIFCHENFINYDREDLTKYFDYIKISPLDKMPLEQQRVATYLRNGGKNNYIIHDLTKGFPQHKDNSVDLIVGNQMIEHLNPIFETPKFITECYRMLKVGGTLLLSTPDLNLLINAYLNNQMNKFADDQPEFYKSAPSSAQLAYLMYASCGPNSTNSYYEGHHMCYSQESMTHLLNGCGFKKIRFFYQGEESDNLIVRKFVHIPGMSHSFAVEAEK